VENVLELVFAFDADKTGQAKARELTQAATLRGKTARVLPPESYGGRKDANDGWLAGALDIKGWEG
jgi:DNA primase